MGSFFKKIKELFAPAPKTIKKQSVLLPEPQIVNINKKKEHFDYLANNSKMTGLFIFDPVPLHTLPVYDIGGGEKELITLDNTGKPIYLKTERTKITLELQENLTENSLINCLTLAGKYAQPVGNVDEYKKTDGWATVSGNKIEDRLHYNVYIKDFPYTLFLPMPEFLGLVCQCTSSGIEDGFGFFMLLEKVRIL